MKKNNFLISFICFFSLFLACKQEGSSGGGGGGGGQREKVLIDTEYYVSPGSYRTVSLSLSAGNEISGYFSVRSYDINFYIFNEVNYYKWKSGEAANGIIVKNRSSYSTFSFTVSTSGYYYIVLDNTYSILTGKYVYVYVKAVY
jgi:hypothetical protein